MAFIIDDINFTKQNINLSEAAFYIMSCDYTAFTNKPSLDDKIPSGFLNRIFQNFYADAKATLEPNSVSYPKGVHFNFRLQKETQCILTDENKIGNIDKYYLRSNLKSRYPSVGKYLKAIFEEYAVRPYFEREKIYFKSEYQTIEYAIEMKRTIEFDYRGTHYDIIPHVITLDEWSSYNYIIGFSKDNKVVNFRLSFMENIKISSGSQNAFKKNHQELLNALTTKGIQFVTEQTNTIKVLFNQAGKDKYDHMIFMRPGFKTTERLKDGNYLYTFECTERQAEYYFFKFGEDATIIEPLSLRELFKKKLIDALHNYE